MQNNPEIILYTLALEHCALRSAAVTSSTEHFSMQLWLTNAERFDMQLSPKTDSFSL